MTEEWRPIFSGLYSVSSHGRVRREKPGRRTWPGRILDPIKMKIGYMMVGPVVAGKNVRVYVHAIVAKAFLGPRPAGTEVNHIDGDKTNNRLSNLEYVTHHGNMTHARRSGLMVIGSQCGTSKLTERSVKAMRKAWSRGERNIDLSRRFAVSPATVNAIVYRKSWRHV